MSYFIWPKPKIFISLLSSFGFKSNKQIENKLSALYPNSFPVLCASARVAIHLILSHKNFTRKDLIAIFPFANSCVIDAIAKTSTPTCVFKEDAVKIIYNQWGYKNTNLDFKNILIEDSVDTLVEPNNSVFNNVNSQFAIWSFPKIMGTISGSVIWCRNKNDSIILKKKIAIVRGSLIMWILKILSTKYNFFYKIWNSFIYDYPNLTHFECSEIFNKLKNINKIILDRKNKIKLLQGLTLIKLDISSGFLPPVLPIECDRFLQFEKYIESDIGLRHFSYDHNKEYKQVFPLPIHQDISYRQLELFKKKFYNE